MAMPVPSRAHDALYDPTYTVSGARDHYKQQGQAGGFLIQRVPEHANLFSELQHYPTSTFRIKGNDRLPAFLNKAFHPHQHNPATLQQQSSAQQVSGPHQFKYFKRPLLPHGARLAVPLHLAPQAPPPPAVLAAPEPLIKDAATQSDYRENETQTLPWSPDWVLPTDPAVLAKQAILSAKLNCQGPEVLQLADLRFGDGLPGGLQEVRRLEKQREKRAFEAALPPIDDADHLPERQALIEAWEANEWAEREREIRGVQDERLALLQQALQVREEEIEEAHRAQVGRRSSSLMASMAPRFAAIHASRIKTIRQLAEKRRQVDAIASHKQPSIIDKYADYGSAVYAPPQREGRFPDTTAAAAATAATASARSAQPGAMGRSQQLPLDADALAPATLAGLQELTATLPARALQPVMRKPRPPAKLSYSQRAEAAVQRDVEAISSMLQSATATHGRGVGQVWPFPIDARSSSLLLGPTGSAGLGLGTNRSSSKLLATPGRAAGASSSKASRAASAASAAVRAAAAGERPGTPEAPPLPDSDGSDAALVLLQRLLRGRAVQNDMFAGKTAQLALVRELRLELEGTAGCQPRPEAVDAATQEVDALVGAQLCRLCCLLSSDDDAGVAELLQRVAARRPLQQQPADAAEEEELQSQQAAAGGGGEPDGQQQDTTAADAASSFKELQYNGQAMQEAAAEAEAQPLQAPQAAAAADAGAADTGAAAADDGGAADAGAGAMRGEQEASAVGTMADDEQEAEQVPAATVTADEAAAASNDQADDEAAAASADGAADDLPAGCSSSSCASGPSSAADPAAGDSGSALVAGSAATDNQQLLAPAVAEEAEGEGTATADAAESAGEAGCELAEPVVISMSGGIVQQQQEEEAGDPGAAYSSSSSSSSSSEDGGAAADAGASGEDQLAAVAAPEASISLAAAPAAALTGDGVGSVISLGSGGRSGDGVIAADGEQLGVEGSSRSA